MRRVLLIDNYDSFTYNLVQALRILGAEVDVRRNDAIDVATARAGDFTHLVISPGPGRPEGAGCSMEMIRSFAGSLPLLGVCLGHQALAATYGARIGSAQRLMHGKASRVYHDGRPPFEGLPNPLDAGRYHSLAVDEETLSDELTVCAYTSDGEVMGLRHRCEPTLGVQFHPESVLTPLGDRLLGNFLELEGPETGR